MGKTFTFDVYIIMVRVGDSVLGRKEGAGSTHPVTTPVSSFRNVYDPPPSAFTG